MSGSGYYTKRRKSIALLDFAILKLYVQRFIFYTIYIHDIHDIHSRFITIDNP